MVHDEDVEQHHEAEEDGYALQGVLHRHLALQLLGHVHFLGGVDVAFGQKYTPSMVEPKKVMEAHRLARSIS